MKIKDLKMNTSNVLSLLLVGIEERTTKSNSKYLVLTLTDGKSTIKANLWNSDRNNFEARESEVLEVQMETKEYNGAASYTVTAYAVTSESIDYYVPTAPIPADKMYHDISKYAERLGPYSGITCRLLAMHKDKLLTWAAAKQIHHNICSGLLYHMYRMLQAAVKLAQVYTDIDKDLLFAGVILHDIGKIQEMDCNEVGNASYSVDGTLLSHLYIGCEMVAKYAEESGLTKEQELLLKHMIASHHGKLEYGAISLPAIPEAALLNHIDCIDAEMYQFEHARDCLEPGSLSEKVYGLGTSVYMPRGSEEY